MSKKLSEYIGITQGGKNTDYQITDDALFFVNGTSKFKPSKQCTFIYYVIGGGADGSRGTGTYSIGRGGGGGAVQIGRVTLEPDIEYTVKINSALNGNGGNTVFKSANGKVDITANGGKVTASGRYGNSGDGGRQTGGENVTLHRDASSPASGAVYGNGGISSMIGGTAGKAGTSTSINGGNGISIGSGGGGGYGSAGTGGIGRNGAVFLIDVDHSNIVQHVEKQLRELNQLPGTMVDQYNQQYNATMMAGALWTVLATSLVFYVFTQV